MRYCALHRDGLSAKDSQNNPIAVGQFDQQSLGKARFYLQEIRLSTTLAVRRVYGIANVNAQSGQEEDKASVIDNKYQSGGDAPLPRPLSSPCCRSCGKPAAPNNSRASSKPKNSSKSCGMKPAA